MEITSYEHWKALPPEAYRAEKARVTTAVVAGLDHRFPGLRAQVEVTDVATPLTTERLAGSYLVGYQAWPVPNKNCWMRFPARVWAGPWPACPAFTRRVIADICKLGRRFVAALSSTSA